jgi:hypothetical protein
MIVLALWRVLSLVDGFRIGDSFVLVYSISLVDCFSLVDGFGSGGWIVLSYSV